jgi:hypothetical protein
MTVQLHDEAFEFARKLIEEGRVIMGDHEDWLRERPSGMEENEFFQQHRQEYGKWFLAVNIDEEEKDRYLFPIGNFESLHQGALITIEQQAAQGDYLEIEEAARNLLQFIEAG